MYENRDAWFGDRLKPRDVASHGFEPFLCLRLFLWLLRDRREQLSVCQVVGTKLCECHFETKPASSFYRQQLLKECSFEIPFWSIQEKKEYFCS